MRKRIDGKSTDLDVREQMRYDVLYNGKTLQQCRNGDSMNLLKLLLSDDTIKIFAGHKDISTTQKCYIHQVKPITDYADVFKAVFDAS